MSVANECDLIGAHILPSEGREASYSSNNAREEKKDDIMPAQTFPRIEYIETLRVWRQTFDGDVHVDSLLARQ